MASLRDVLPRPLHDGSNESSKAARTKNARDSEPVRRSASDQKVVGAAVQRGAGVSSVVPLPSGADGSADFSAIARTGENSNRVVHASYDAVVEKPRSQVDLARPSQDVIDDTTKRTKDALEPIVRGKVQASHVKNFRGSNDKRVAEFVRYTPANTNVAHNSGARQRIIKMVQAPVDPMEPPRFSRKKTPANPPSPPVPVLHSPPRKLSKEEAADWVIPPAISNWKNNRGYTIPLDKRLASDASSLQDNHINDKFATLAEAMYMAERNAREEVEKRAEIQRNVSLRAKEAKEKELRDLAARARSERAGISLAHIAVTADAGSQLQEGDPPTDSTQVEGGPNIHVLLQEESPPALRNGSSKEPARAEKPARRSRFEDVRVANSRLSVADEFDDAENDDVKRRDAIREDRKREREREMRIRDARGDDSNRPLLKKSKLTRDRDRDLSERVALGQSVADAGPGEVMYDQRLFNQAGTHTGFTAGFGGEDTDILYDKPLFSGASASKFQYHPRAAANVLSVEDNEDNRDLGDVSRYRADRALGGDATRRQRGSAVDDAGYGRQSAKVDDSRPVERSRVPRSTLVEFERDYTADGGDAASDPFGLNDMLGRMSETRSGVGDRKMDRALNARHGTRNNNVGLSRFKKQEGTD